MTPIQKTSCLAHAKSKSYLIKLDKTKKFISNFNKYATSCSWGKDSVVLAHLASQLIPQHCILNARYPNPNERFADIDRVRNEMLNRLDMVEVKYFEVNTPGEWDMYEKVGYAFESQSTTEEKKAAKWWKDSFIENMRKKTTEIECEGNFIGLCAEESRGRRINALFHGQSYQKKDGQKIALPLSWWTCEDIWAYIISNELPYLKVYSQSIFGRCRARSGFVFATTGKEDWIHSQGIWVDYMKVYPEEFQVWLDRFPELQQRMY